MTSSRVDTEQAGSVLCKQDGVFRVNCMDCLDRTNVIQSVLSREVLQSAVSATLYYSLQVYMYHDNVSVQLQKLGVIPFEEKLEGVTLQAYQELWANNGDFISRQYTGTAAMKVNLSMTWNSICEGQGIFLEDVDIPLSAKKI